MIWEKGLKPWGGSFDIDAKQKQIEEDEAQTLAPGFWDDPKKAETLLKAIQEKKSWTETFRRIENEYEDLTVLWEFFNSGDTTEAEVESHYDTLLKRVEDLELRNMLRNEEDKMGAILTVN